MRKISLDDTIAAIATPIGEGGIGIVRLSGKEAISIADRIFASKDGKRPSGYETYTTHYGQIIDLPPSTFQPRPDIVDEVLLTVMKAPKSYTREDIVEINCHGGIIPLRRVLELTLRLGARLAEPGEFTKRAFLNGRIDLAQAEAVLDVITAKTQKGLDIALLQLEGRLSDSISLLRDKLMDVKVNLEAVLDFPDEGISAYSREEVTKRLSSIKNELEEFVKSFDCGKIIREGAACVICGRPNVGKSSLMNAILKEERAIVTPVPGTTRDAICEYVNIDGIALNIVDTAGIVKTNDPVEKEGVIRSRVWIDRADLILFMADAAGDLSDEDRAIIELIKDREVICVLNKIDLPRHEGMNAERLKKYFGKEIPFVEVSVLKGINLDTIFKAITDAVWKGRISAGDRDILTNARHKDSFAKALHFVGEALVSLENAQSEETIAFSIDEAIFSMGEITGDLTSQEVLDRIFSRFCVGK